MFLEHAVGGLWGAWDNFTLLAYGSDVLGKEIRREGVVFLLFAGRSG